MSYRTCRIHSGRMSSLHFVLESLFFLSGIALTVIAAIGLRQLTVAKEIARIGAKRDSLKLAADQCAHYMHNIIPLQNALYEAIQTKHIAFFDKSEVEVKGDQVKVTSTATPADVDALKTIAYEFLAAFTQSKPSRFFLFPELRTKNSLFQH